MGAVEIVEDDVARLRQADAIPIAYLVRSVLDVVVEGAGLGGIRLREVAVPEPYVKDYDVDTGGGPSRLAERFDVSRWGLLSARRDGRLVGSCLVAWDTPGVWLLEDRRDVAVAWDLRIQPEHRGRGLGARLLAAAEEWARGRGCRRLKIETQNVNVPACRFYAAQGCELGGIDRFAYPTLPDEVQLLWHKALG